MMKIIIKLFISWAFKYHPKVSILVIYSFFTGLFTFFYSCEFKNNVDSFIFSPSLTTGNLDNKNVLDSDSSFYYHPIHSGEISLAPSEFYKKQSHSKYLMHLKRFKERNEDLYYISGEDLFKLVNAVKDFAPPHFFKEIDRLQKPIEKNMLYYFILYDDTIKFVTGIKEPEINYLHGLKGLVTDADSKRKEYNKFSSSLSEKEIREKYLKENYDWTDFLYFSLLASTGTSFGDIIPNSGYIRILVTIQLYLSIILMGFLIGSLTSIGTKQKEEGE